MRRARREATDRAAHAGSQDGGVDSTEHSSEAFRLPDARESRDRVLIVMLGPDRQDWRVGLRRNRGQRGTQAVSGETFLMRRRCELSLTCMRALTRKRGFPRAAGERNRGEPSKGSHSSIRDHKVAHHRCIHSQRLQLRRRRTPGPWDFARGPTSTTA